MIDATHETPPVFYVRMFGGFELTAGGKSISDSINHTRQLWNLLEYLFAHRRNTISQRELIQALWPDGGIDNPSNALKNLAYRVRTILANNHIPLAKELIVYCEGSYRINSELPCVLDTEEFEALSQQAARLVNHDSLATVYLDMFDLYRGDFLPGSRNEKWAAMLTGYYRSLFYRNVRAAAELFFSMERYDDVCAICRRAIRIDPLDESAYPYYIRALIQQNRQAEALECYNSVTELFYRELGVRPSENMRGLYREIAKTVNNVETDLSIIKEDLREEEVAGSAFYCDYEVFKNLYRLEARAIARSGQTFFVGLFTITDTQGKVPETKQLAPVMDQLRHTVCSGLRRGDVVSRFSPTQFVIMLPALTYENGLMVMERISKRFKGESRAKNVILHTNLQPLDPID